MRNRVAVMHGVNLGALDRRPAEHYGGLTFAKLEYDIEQFARELELDARFFQTDHEGAFIEELHNAPDYADGLLLNPGAWSHYAWPLTEATQTSSSTDTARNGSRCLTSERWTSTAGSPVSSTASRSDHA